MSGPFLGQTTRATNFHNSGSDPMKMGWSDPLPPTGCKTLLASEHLFEAFLVDIMLKQAHGLSN